MNDLINKHTIKIQLGVLTGIVGAIIYWTFMATGMIEQVNANAAEINNVKKYIDRIIILEERFLWMQQTISEIKIDVKKLLEK